MNGSIIYEVFGPFILLIVIFLGAIFFSNSDKNKQ